MVSIKKNILFLLILIIVYFIVYFCIFFFILKSNFNAAIISFLINGFPFFIVFSFCFLFVQKAGISVFISGIVFFTFRHISALEAAAKSRLDLRRFGYDVFIDGSISSSGIFLSFLVYIGHISILFASVIIVIGAIRRFYKWN